MIKNVRKFAFILLLGLIIGYGVYLDQFSEQETQNTQQPTRATGTVRSGEVVQQRIPCPADEFTQPDYAGLKEIIKNQPFVQDLPKKGSVRLRFYHFTGPCRVWDKSYYLTKGSVEEKNAVADIDVWIHAKYVPQLRTEDLCAVLSEAEKNNDYGRASELGKAKLTFRYGKLLGYRKCFGL